MGVQLGEGTERGNGHQEVPAPEAHQRLDVALLVAPGHPAEVVGEQEVALQAQELILQFTLGADHLLHGDP